MFERADKLLPVDDGQKKLLQDKIKIDVPVHFLSYEWDGFTPRFYGFDKEAEEVVELNLWELNHNLSYSMICTGSWHDGEYRPCPDQKKR